MRSAKRLLTGCVLARVRFFASVSSDVCLQVMARRECLATAILVAMERPLLGVSAIMFLQIRQSGKNLEEYDRLDKLR